MVASCSTSATWGIVPSRASVVALMLCVWAHVPVGARLLVRGGDLLCEAENCRGGPSGGELVGDAAK
jgi:hypothetical protein